MHVPRGLVFQFGATFAMTALAATGCRDAALGPSAPQLAATQTPGAQAFTFTTILDSQRDGFNPFELGCPAINDAGVVAFRGRRNDGLFTGVFRGTGAAITTIVRDNLAGYSFIGRHPSINSAGTVSFAANLRSSAGGGEAIVRARPGNPINLARTEPGIFEFFGFDTSINDSGRVAFKAELDNFDEGLFTATPAGIQTIFLASSSQFQGTLEGPAINNRGHVAFHEDLDAGGSGIFLWNGSAFVTIATDAGSINSFASLPSLNNSGIVAFSAFLDNGASAIMRGNGRELTTVASTAGPFSDFLFSGPAVNDSGRVAFAASLDTGTNGIFVTPNAIGNRVIQSGDSLSGSTVGSVVLCREALNRSGQVAFQAFLDDGRVLIVRANPN
jgi:hypothetical protein